MISNINEVLTAYMSKGGRKSGEADANSDAFQALLSALMGQGMNVQGSVQENIIEELQSGLAGRIMEMSGTKGQELNMTDVFGINTMMFRMMSGMDFSTQNVKADENSLKGVNDLKGFEEIVKGLLEASGHGHISDTDKLQADMLIDSLTNEAAGDVSKSQLTFVESAASKADNQRISMQSLPQVLDEMLNNTEIINSNSNEVITSKNNIDAPEDAAKIAEVSKNADTDAEQFIIARPELLKMMKGESTKMSNDAASFNLQGQVEKGNEKSMNLNSQSQVDEANEKLATVKGAENNPGDFMNMDAKENKSEMPDFNQNNTVHPAADDKNNYASKMHDISSAANPPDRLNKDDVLNQIYDKMKVINGKDTSELHIRLKPETLGEVSIKLIMDKGVMTARIMVENSQVRNLVESNIPQIKESLKSQNFDVTNFNVSVGLSHGDLSNNQNFSSNRWAFNKKGYFRSGGTVQVEEIKLGEVSAQRGALNLLA